MTEFIDQKVARLMNLNAAIAYAAATFEAGLSSREDYDAAQSKFESALRAELAQPQLDEAVQAIGQLERLGFTYENGVWNKPAQPISWEVTVMLQLAESIAASAHLEDDSRLEVAYAIARHLKLDWRSAYQEPFYGEAVYQMKSVIAGSEWEPADADKETCLKRMPHWAGLLSAAPQPPSAAMQPPGANWSVKVTDWNPPRVQLTIGVQSFCLNVEYDRAEPERQQWYAEQLKTAIANTRHAEYQLSSAAMQPLADEVHSCSFFCDLPDCIKTQRDLLRDQITKAAK